ncbi:MAG: ArsR family transcriptional regulator [Methanobacteriota archaeon]
MPTPTAIRIFKELKHPKSISEIAHLLGLDHSTISTSVSSLVEEGLAQKHREGKKTLIRRSDTLHARSLEEFMKEYPRLPIEDIFSYSSMEILSMLMHPHNITEIAAMTTLNRHTVSEALSKLSKYGLILKEKGKFVINKRHRQLADFIKSYWRHAANQRLRAEDAVMLWQRGPEFLFKTQIEPGKSIEPDDIQAAAITVFSRYGLRLITGTRYYFHSRRRLTVEDHIIHTILIDPQNPIYNSYAAALIMRSGAKNLPNAARIYDIPEHMESLLEYVRIKKKNSNFVLPWNEYMDLFDSMVVS